MEKIKKVLKSLQTIDNEETGETILMLREISSLTSTCKMDCGSPTGCCRSCYKENGHFNKNHDVICLNRSDWYEPSRVIKNYLRYWKPKVGFWSSKGCRLPRKLRSTTCLTFHCMINGASKYHSWYSCSLRELTGMYVELAGNFNEAIFTIGILNTFPEELKSNKLYKKFKYLVEKDIYTHGRVGYWKQK